MASQTMRSLIPTLAFLYLILLPSPLLAADQVTEKGVVIKVIDGDTIVVKIGNKLERVRLIGVDTPEVLDPRKKVQCFGKEASQQMYTLAKGKNVVLQSEPRDKNRDTYGRLLRYIYLTDQDGKGSKFLNRAMIEDGFAYAYTRFDFEFKKSFTGYEKTARESKRGLWKETTCKGKR